MSAIGGKADMGSVALQMSALQPKAYICEFL